MRPSRARTLGLLASALAAGLPARVRSQAEAPIRIGAATNDGYAEPYYGLDQGFFKQAGLNVDVQTISTGSKTTTAIAAGALDVGISNPISVANAVDHGVPVLFFAAAGLYNPPTFALCVEANSPIKTAKDLNGATIATTALDDSNSLHVRAWVDQHGGDSSTLKFVEIPFSAMAAAVSRGTVAAAPIAEPNVSAATSSGELRVVAHTMDVYGRNFMVGGWVAHKDWLANVALARRFATCIYTIAHWANAHRDETMVILAKYAKLDPATIRGMARTPYAEFLTPGMFQSYLDLGYKYHYVAHRLNASDLMAKL
jgi:NitT/TauT family transport system substrate-binding protein